MPANKKDLTGNDRQRRRRERERQWLKGHGFTSWEQVHTKLMTGDLILKNHSAKKQKVFNVSNQSA